MLSAWRGIRPLATDPSVNDTASIFSFTLMHEIELLGGSNFSGLSERNYLWGEAALKRRREQQDEKLLSKYNSVDNDETTVDRCKRKFRENLIFDPKVCGEIVLYFPSKRSA